MGDKVPISTILRSDAFDRRVIEFLAEYESVRVKGTPLNPPEDAEDWLENYATSGDFNRALTLNAFLEFLDEGGEN